VTDLSSLFTQAMTRPTIICDVDGVLANFCSAACEAVNAHFGTSYTPMIWTTYRGPFNDEEHAWLVSERFTDAAFWMSESPNRDAIGALHQLATAGYRIVVSSERPAEQSAASIVWLEFYRVPLNQVYLIGPGGKVALCSEHGPDNPAILIDDSPERWTDCAGEGVEILCPRTGYTPDSDGVAHVQVFDHFHQIPELVAEMGL
jgi:hypothetical protein